MTMTTPEDCLKFHTCGAPVCPLDPDWRHTVHRWGEPACYYLRNSVKAGADERFADDPVYQVCKVQLPLVCERFPDIGRKVAEATRSGFQGNHLRRENRPQPARGCD
jgi:hypothetical protein